MRYREFLPNRALAPYVHCLWTLERDYHGTAETVWPDGRAELILHGGDRYSVEGSGTGLLPREFVIGPLTRYVRLVSSGRVRLAGARFHAWGLAPFLGMHGRALRDRVLPAAELPDALYPALENDSEVIEPQVTVRRLEAFLLERLAPASPPDTDVAMLAQALSAPDSRLTVGEAAQRLGVSPRQLQRRFSAAIGIGPRALANLGRFNAARLKLAREPGADVVDLGFELGYADYPHFSRDFRRCFGMSPFEFVRWATSMRAGAPDVAFVQDSPRPKP